MHALRASSRPLRPCRHGLGRGRRGRPATVNFDRGWKFLAGDAAGAKEAGFDDRAWQAVDLPHTWNAFDGQDGGDDYRRGAGWYRRHLPLDGAFAGRRLYLQFDGASLMADVYVNGVRLGRHSGGFAVQVRRNRRPPPGRGQRGRGAGGQREARHTANGG